MAQLIPSLATLVAAFSDCFHPQVFQTFQALLAGWITCQGPRTISEVWLATGLAAKRHHDTAYAVFHSACLGVGRPGHRPGHADPDPPGPRRRRLDRRR